jgi:intergrase/recombinase/post-segregation antitoxin (ccd killing protein)
MKVRTSILIEKAILKEAQKLGVNVSAFTEYALTQAISTIKNINFQTNQNQTANPQTNKEGFGNVVLVRSPGFEPGIASLEDLRIDWEGFCGFMREKSKSQYARYCVDYARKYAHCLLNGNFSEVQSLPKTVRGNVVKALSNLAKYLGIYPKFKELMRSHAIEWKGKSSDDLVIERLTKTSNPDDVFAWIRQVKHAREDLADFMDFMAITGMRFNEAIASYNLIISLSREKRLNEYYNEGKETLEHYKFKDIFLRRSKKVFVSFVPKMLIEKIRLNEPLPNSRYAIEQRIRKRGLPLKFSDVREANATFLTKYLRREEIDFIQGRVSSNVFMEHYFNPSLISDLKERVFKAIAEIETKIS